MNVSTKDKIILVNAWHSKRDSFLNNTSAIIFGISTIDLGFWSELKNSTNLVRSNNVQSSANFSFKPKSVKYFRQPPIRIEGLSLILTSPKTKI